MNTLRLYALLASVWVKVSDLMNLDVSTTTTIATKHNGDPEKCIRDVIGRWMNDQEKLSANYKCTWNEICRLLEDLEHSTASSQLKEALAADISSFNKNIQRQGSADCKILTNWEMFLINTISFCYLEVSATRLDHHEKSSQDFIAPYTCTKPHEGNLLTVFTNSS